MCPMSDFFRQFRNGDVFPWERDFTREFFGVAVPIAIQSMFGALLHIIDNIMIGQLGEVELAAVTQANRITFLFQLTIFGLCSGTATYVAQFWGKRDIKGIRQVMGLALCLALVSALLFLVPAMVAPRFLMGLLLNEEATIGAAVQYLPTISLTYIFFALTQCYATVQKSTEQARLPMFGGILALITNTFLNYCLIFGNLGFPRLGVRGGAIATVIAAAVEFLIVVIGGYVARFATAAKLSELIPRSAQFVKKYLTIVLPVIANEGLWSLGIVMYSAVYGRMGTGAVAALSVFNTVQQVALATMRGLNNGAAVMVGKRIGAGDEQAAHHTAKRMLFSVLPSSVFSGLLLLAVSVPLTALFNVSGEVLRDARTMIYLSAGLLWLGNLAGLLIVGVMRAGGDVKMSLYVDAGSAWFVGVPLVALAGLVLKWPIAYVYLVSTMESVVKASLGLWRFRSKKWIHNLVR